MRAESTSTEPVVLGSLTLFEPLDARDVGGPWIGRQSGSVELILVDRFASPEVLRRPDLKELVHPNLVSLLDRREEEGVLCQLRELVLGTSLAQILRRARERREVVPLDIVFAWARDASEALAYLHDVRASDGTSLGLGHGRVSSSTAFVNFWGKLQLGDYEVVRPRAGGLEEPETLRGRDAAGFLGLLYEMLTLDAPTPAAGPPQREDLPPDVHAAVVELFRAPESDESPRMREIQFRVMGAFSSIGTPATGEAIAAWLRPRVAEVEAQVLARIARVRKAETKAAARRAPDEPEEETTDVEGLELLAPEPREPSVITMPGALLAPGPQSPSARRRPSETERHRSRGPTTGSRAKREAQRPRSARRRSRGRGSSLRRQLRLFGSIGLFGLALMLLMLALWLRQRPPAAPEQPIRASPAAPAETDREAAPRARPRAP